MHKRTSLSLPKLAFFYFIWPLRLRFWLCVLPMGKVKVKFEILTNLFDFDRWWWLLTFVELVAHKRGFLLNFNFFTSWGQRIHLSLFFVFGISHPGGLPLWPTRLPAKLGFLSLNLLRTVKVWPFFLVNWKTVLVPKNICRLFQLIFDSDHNFHDHRSRFYM